VVGGWAVSCGWWAEDQVAHASQKHNNNKYSVQFSVQFPFYSTSQIGNLGVYEGSTKHYKNPFILKKTFQYSKYMFINLQINRQI